MKINRNNYESWFIDYLDGNLPEKEMDDLLDFLHENPDLAEELKEFDCLNVAGEPLEAFDWSYLKKEVPEGISPFESLCIRYIEKEMDDTEASGFLAFTALHPEKQKELDRFKSAKLIPDEKIIFGKTGKLKKQIIPFQFIRMVAAAVLLLAMTLWFVRPHTESGSNKEKPQLAKSLISIRPEEKVPSLIVPKTEFKKISNGVQATASFTAKVELKENKKSPIEMVPVQNEELMPMASIPVTLVIVNSEPVSLESNLAKTIPNTKDYSLYRTIPQLLASEIQSIDSKEKVNELTRGFLSSVRRWSNDRFDFQNDKNGKITKIEYNSRILAFSVPLGDEDY